MWRDKYNLKYATLQSRRLQSEEWRDAAHRTRLQGKGKGKAKGASGELADRNNENTRAQYGVLAREMLKPVVGEEGSEEPDEPVEEQTQHDPAQAMDVQHVPEETNTPAQEDAMDRHTHQSPEEADSPTPTQQEAPSIDLRYMPAETDVLHGVVEMQDAYANGDVDGGGNIDADGEDDPDAEGEEDDEM